MYILGFESTAHTFGAAVVEFSRNSKKLTPGNTKIISQIDKKFPSLKEGFIPRKLADFHAKNFPSILSQALSDADFSISDLDAVCYSYGPGIGHSLHVGYIAAKSISISQKIPLIPVNHALAHIEIARFHSDFDDPLAIYVSGGNTQLLVKEPLSKKYSHYRVLGETLDIGLGNYLDQVGRHLQLSPPDAVGVLKEAEKGKTLLSLPYLVKGMSTSFSGMLTSVRKLDLSKYAIPDICYSSQEYAFSMLLEAAERALTLTSKKQIVGVGGNYRNKRLQQMTQELAREHHVKLHIPSFQMLGDNAGMIAITGALQLHSKCFNSDPSPNQKARIGKEKVSW